MGKKNEKQKVPVVVKFGGPTGPSRTQNMSPDDASVWTDGGVQISKFDALDVYSQFDRLKNTWIVGALRSSQYGMSNKIAEWQSEADENGVYTHTLPTDFPKCPTSGFPAVAYNPAA